MDKSNVFSIIKKELRLYFNSPIAYIVVFIFLLLSGFFYSRPLFVYGYVTLRHYFDLLPLFLLFFVPAITMRIFSEEYKTGTIEIIYTLPFRKIEILLGKYISSISVVIFGLLFTLIYPISLIFLGKLDIGMTIAGYIGVLMLVVFYTSVGVFGSSLTKNQIVSFVITFFILFIFFILGKLGMFVGDLASYIGIDLHFDNFVRGIVDVRDIVYFLSLSFLFLYFTYLSIQKEK
jgi:ABC-2 type transport system permease protein